MPGETVYTCYTITNTGNVTLTTHNLVDDLAGVILTDTIFSLPPGQNLSTLQLGRVISAEVAITTTTVATWTATMDAENLSATAVATASVDLGKGELELDVVGSFMPPPSGKGRLGGQMVYDLNVRNSGTATLKQVKLSFVVPPDSIFFTDADFFTDAELPQSAASSGWDCPKGTPAGTTCTLTLARLSPGETISSRVALLIIGESGTEGLTVDFNATAEGTPLTPGPALHVVVTEPHGTQGLYALYLPKIKAIRAPFPFEILAD